MGKDLWNVFNVPLRSRDLDTTVNLLDGRFDCTGANGAKLLCLKIIVIDAFVVDGERKYWQKFCACFF